MKKFKLYIILIVILAAAGLVATSVKGGEDRFVAYTVPPANIQMFLKDGTGKNFGSIQDLKEWVESQGKKLYFAMNGGMYKPDHTPQGLYIEKGKTISDLDTAGGRGNFYLEPNGVFYITAGSAAICPTGKFRNSKDITYATQSGPMLVIDGEIHPAFRRGSANLQVRNGVGILPNGKVHFALSKEPVNFYDFAEYFKNLGCKNALYLDGFVSRAYLPEANCKQTDGNFGVIIAVTN